MYGCGMKTLDGCGHKDGTYPYLYSYLKENWIFIDLNSLTYKRFYDFSSEQWVFNEKNIEVDL